MTPQYILRAALRSMVYGHHRPHCFSTWIGGTYSDGSDPSTRTEYLLALARACETEIDNLGYAPAYAEPGYTDPERGILFADWNKFPRDFDRVLQRAGYETEWSDEWSTCEDCGRAFRTSPDSYHYSPYYMIIGECSIVCLDCVDWPSYLAEHEDDPDWACPRDVDPGLHGYTLIAGAYDHAHTETPETVLAQYHARGERGILFRHSDVSTVYRRFEVWRNDDAIAEDTHDEPTTDEPTTTEDSDHVR